MQEEEINVGEFVQLLMNSPSQISISELLRYGHFRLWLEDSDERHPEAVLNRQTAARIVHQFLKIECGIPDISDITPATQLKDLYTCRVCAEHIAQVYVRNIMNAQNINETGEPDFSDSPVLIFNHLASVTKAEATQILKKVSEIRRTSSAD